MNSKSNRSLTTRSSFNKSDRSLTRRDDFDTLIQLMMENDSLNEQLREQEIKLARRNVDQIIRPVVDQNNVRVKLNHLQECDEKIHQLVNSIDQLKLFFDQHYSDDGSGKSITLETSPDNQKIFRQLIPTVISLVNDGAVKKRLESNEINIAQFNDVLKSLGSNLSIQSRKQLMLKMKWCDFQQKLKSVHNSLHN